MGKYTIESFTTDCEWLREQGVLTHEVEYFVKNLIKEGFLMSRKEFVNFMEATK